jgi:hypothetical protein
MIMTVMNQGDRMLMGSLCAFIIWAIDAGKHSSARVSVPIAERCSLAEVDQRHEAEIRPGRPG